MENGTHCLISTQLNLGKETPRQWTGREILIKQQLVHMEFINGGVLVIYITFVYGSNDGEEWKTL